MSARRDPVKPFGRHLRQHRVIIDRGHSVTDFTIPSWVLKASGVAVLGLTLWAGTVTGVMLMRGETLEWIASKVPSTEVQVAYQDRIDALRAQVDHLQSKSLVEKSTIEDKVEKLLQRQAQIESRAGVLQSLDGMAQSLGLRAAESPVGDAEFGPNDAQSGPNDASSGPNDADLDTITITPGPAKEAALSGPVEKSDRLDLRLGQIDTALATLEEQQLVSLATMEAKAREKAGQIREAVASIGLDADKLMEATSAEGGPFVPLEPMPGDDPFETQAQTAQSALVEINRLKKALLVVPLRRPFPDAAITSGFGARNDPFLGTLAMHAGIDFRESEGAPVSPTAAGVVTEAGWIGGYGNMVEVSHGNGLSTRYGHLSQINVRVGDRVEVGDKIGEVGSTGRSTGPHLHYETRVDGEAVDPMRFLRAGRKISG